MHVGNHLITIHGTALALACCIAGTLNAQNLFVGSWSPPGAIGEYTTSGATINASLISGVADPSAITLSISGNDLFVANYSGSTIGEYTTSGATVNASLSSGLYAPAGIAISGNDMFVTNGFAGTVGEYTTSGATVNASLISGLNEPYGIAVATVPEPAAGVLASAGALAVCLWRRRK
jgi:DNA-binding beta-propeller fold protein YncE